MNSRRLNITNLIISLGALIVISFIHLRIYRGIGTIIPILILNAWLLVNLVDFFKNRDLENNYILKLGIGIIFLSFIIYTINSPKVSFAKAEEIVRGEGITNVEETEFLNYLEGQLDLENKISESYLFKGILEDKKVYCLVNSVDGSVKIENVGDSYIDRLVGAIKDKRAK